MIYHLFEALKELNFPGHGLFTYLSFRAILASITALIVALWFGKKYIAWMSGKDKEKQRDCEIEHTGAGGLEEAFERRERKRKSQTPAMGGVIFLVALVCAALLFCDLTNIYVQLMLLTTIWLGAVGYCDDYIKVKKDKEGMNAKVKLLCQIALGFVIALTVCLSDKVDTTKLITTFPFVKGHEFDYSWLSPFRGQLGVYCTWGIFVAMIVFVTTACSNSVNLTDGLDGLATGTSAIVGVVIGIFAWLSGNTINAEYLNIMYVPGAGEIFVFMAALVGGLIGFLWYNSYPAQIFMGDTGSLALGGIIGVSAILIRKELLLPLLCGVFFVETLSVIIQRIYFKRTKKKYGAGKRIFRYTPIHGHFNHVTVDALIKKPADKLEENKIVVRFWIVGILLAVATFALLKIR